MGSDDVVSWFRGFVEVGLVGLNCNMRVFHLTAHLRDNSILDTR